jgi:hypothetical protein
MARSTDSGQIASSFGEQLERPKPVDALRRIRSPRAGQYGSNKVSEFSLLLNVDSDSIDPAPVNRAVEILFGISKTRRSFRLGF